ncbi:MAG TPA: NIPSNAP family protein [Bryobacteraceae bacterium]|nr:NIPSNAP family protein [Bryobacteraceae bacterium]
MSKLLTLLVILAAAAIGYRLGQTTTASAATGRVFEIRTYTAEPGKLDALHARFRDHTLAIFKKHNMASVGYFAPTDEPLSKNTLTYILSFPSRDAATKSWAEFRADPEWQKVQKESEANGKLVNHVDSVFAQATDYSPLK